MSKIRARWVLYFEGYCVRHFVLKHYDDEGGRYCSQCATDAEYARTRRIAVAIATLKGTHAS